MGTAISSMRIASDLPSHERLLGLTVKDLLVRLTAPRGRSVIAHLLPPLR